MNAADKAKLLALADSWRKESELTELDCQWAEARAQTLDECADELRALVAEIAPEPENDNGNS